MMKDKVNAGKWLVYGAALFQAYHMGRAFHVYDPAGWHVLNVNVGGLILGALMNFIVAQASLRLPTISSSFMTKKALLPKLGNKADDKQKRKYAKDLKKMYEAKTQNIYSQRGFVVLLALSVVMVAPALFILWSETLITFHPIVIGLMAFVGAISPDVAITVGGFIASDSLSDVQRPSQRRSATVSDAVSVAQRLMKRRSSKKSATVEAKIYICACNYQTKNRYEFSGHTRTCETYQQQKHAKLDPSLLIDPSKAVK